MKQWTVIDKNNIEHKVEADECSSGKIKGDMFYFFRKKSRTDIGWIQLTFVAKFKNPTSVWEQI